jgi:Arc/MetJ-type ribon-helix-helix transcriptional regulator
MTIHLKSETEKLVREEIERGHFQSVDDLILRSVRAWQEKYAEDAARGSEASPAEHHRAAVERALEFARYRAIPLKGISVKELLHEGHRL